MKLFRVNFLGFAAFLVKIVQHPFLASLSHKKLFIALKLMLVIASYFVATQSHAKLNKRYEIGAVVGDWQVYSQRTSKKMFVVNIVYDPATNTYKGKIVKVNEGQSNQCHECKSQKKLLGLNYLWGIKPQLNKHWKFTGSYDNGRIVDVNTGAIQGLTLTVNKAKTILKAQRHLSKFKHMGVSEIWLRVKK